MYIYVKILISFNGKVYISEPLVRIFLVILVTDIIHKVKNLFKSFSIEVIVIIM